MNQQTEKAYRAWRRACECGYGTRDNTHAHMVRVDDRIRRLKAKYESLLHAERAAERRQA